MTTAQVESKAMSRVRDVVNDKNVFGFFLVEWTAHKVKYGQSGAVGTLGCSQVKLCLIGQVGHTRKWITHYIAQPTHWV